MSTNLEKAAREVITLFNNLDYDTLVKKMEYNVVLKRILYPDSVHGIGDVTGYLNNHMKTRKPRLVDDNDNFAWNGPLTLIPNDAQNATSAQVSGAGRYVDDNDKTITPITFTLGFVRSSPGDEWSLINSFATPVAATQSLRRG